MPRIVRSARGEMVDFDVILIKAQLEKAPQNIDVKRRQNFIDSKETTERKVKKPDNWVAQDAPVVLQESVPVDSAIDFENNNPES